MDEKESKETKDRVAGMALFRTGSMIILLLLLLASSFGFYFSMQNAISMLFDYRYTDLINSIFNLIVVAAILYLVREFFLKK
ncbi:MAG: hypothetical protein SCH39_05035 [Methanosarcinales archaeon]|nr:hypothetical protein [ANME-2 cluster archaeon]MDF1531113.1 hypothetical protein [ANME-2 cluster archaeon]MDW7775690.1 hypothetical protein [Methanosarcinales archaeon]